MREKECEDERERTTVSITFFIVIKYGPDVNYSDFIKL